MFVVERNLDVILIRAVHHVVVRQDVPIRTDDHPGPGCLLRLGFRKLEIGSEKVKEIVQLAAGFPLPLGRHRDAYDCR